MHGDNEGGCMENPVMRDFFIPFAFFRLLRVGPLIRK
jgi:hypothetical protein